MSVTPDNNVQQIVVPYRSPAERATRDTSTVALSFLITLGIVVLPIVVFYLKAADYSHTAFVALLSAIGIAALTTVINYLLVLQRSMGSDPVYQASRTAMVQARNAAKLQALAQRYGLAVPVSPPAAGYVLTPHTPPGTST